MIQNSKDQALVHSYDAVADEYAHRMADELKKKPFDRALLDRFARAIGSNGGATLDLGCGPGQVGAYLDALGLHVIGVDLSSRMLNEARSLFPETSFVRADLRWLPFADNSVAGAVAFYSIIHLEIEDVRRAFVEVRRILQPGGRLLVSFHVGDDCLHLETWWERKVDVDFRFYRRSAISELLNESGFKIEALATRGPYAPEVEAQTERCYITAVKT